MKQRIVLALGGNALQQHGEATAEAQKKIATKVGEVIADLSTKYELVIAHGNGPQVGNIIIHEEAAATPAAPAMPLETAVAMSQGQIGYWLTQAIHNAFAKHGKTAKIATVISQVIVSRNDPAFHTPTKPIGQFYSEKEAKTLARKNHWTVKEDAGRGWRRVVASPKPIDIVEKKTILELIKDNVIVIAKTKVLKRLKGIDAVIDKDYAAEKLAEAVKADIFVSVTAVPYVYINFGLPDQEPLTIISASEITRLQKYGYFKSGSMLPKVKAATMFAQKGGTGIITDIAHLKDALRGKSGTIITK